MPAIHIGGVTKKERILQIALKSPVHFGQLFMPKDIPVKTTSAYHYEIGYIIDDKSNLKPVILMIARGHAKTKITQASILKDICTYDYDEVLKPYFIVWVAQNKTQSMRNVNFIMNNIENNEKLKYYFGDLKGNGKWNQEELDFKNRSSLICRAGLHGIRGLLKDELRPNRFILDDFEYEGNTKTQHSRDANASTVSSVILPALDPEIGRLQINQTPVHYDSFIMRVYDNYTQHIKDGGLAEEFEWIIYKRATSIEHPLWSEYFDKDKLLRRKAQLVQANELHKWFQEYEMRITTDETSLFGAKVINFWDGELKFEGSSAFLNITMLNHKQVNHSVPVLLFGGCDPASDIGTRSSSDIAIIIIAVDPLGRIFVIEYLVKKSMPDIALDSDESEMGTANQILIKGLRYKTRRFGVEKTALSSGVFNSIAKIKEDEPKYSSVNVTGVSHKGERKIDRIYNGLIGEMNQRKVFIKPDHGRLEKEIETFGEYTKYMDLLDSLEIAKRFSYKPAKSSPAPQKRPIPLDEWEKKYQTTNAADNWKTV